MAQKISQGSFFGRLGTGLGQGLAEQLPKEVERDRLSTGLKKLKENPQASQLDQLIQLYSTPGVTPEIANSVLPALRNESIRNKAGKKTTPSDTRQNTGGEPFNPQEIEKGIPNAPEFGGNGKPRKTTQQPSITTATGEQAATQPIIKATPQQIDDRARDLMNENPELYQGDNAYANAYARAEQELNYPATQQQELINTNQRQENLTNTALTKLKDKVEKKLQKRDSEIFSLIPGEAYNRAENRVKLAVAQGKSTDQATDEASDYLKDMGKNINTLRNNIASRPFFGPVPDQTRKDVQKLKPFFEKNGELELFKDEQKSALDVGDHLASYETWRPNKEQEKVISNITSKDTPEHIAAKLYPTIDNKTSLFSLGYLVNKVGADDQAVINSLSDIDNGFTEKKFDERQNRESTEYYTLTPQMGDLFYSAFLGPAYLAGKSLLNYVTGSKEKLGPIENVKRAFGKE